MDKVPYAIGLSVLSSILTLILLGAGKIVFRYLIQKYGFRIALAHVQDVSGWWYGENPDRDGSVMREAVYLKQTGNRLSGTMKYEYLKTGSSTSRQKKFIVRGILRNDVVSLCYHNANRREKGSGAICLRVSEDGECLAGKWAWWDTVLEAVESSRPEEILKWTRVKSSPMVLAPKPDSSSRGPATTPTTFDSPQPQRHGI